MKENEPSRSAGIIAAHRAIESLKPENQRICYDPFAGKFLPPSFTVIGEHEVTPEKALELFKGVVPGFHEHFIARTRYIDEYLSNFIQRDLEQLVILGAGYDSRAYRFKELNNTIPIFEVDFPSTQNYKKDKLKEILKKIPSNVKFISIDFLNESLPEKLEKKGYSKKLKTLFIWEGVSMYVAAESVDEILAFVAENEGRGSSVIFDFTYADVVEGKSELFEARQWLKITSKSDEPLIFGLEKDGTENFLKVRGFHNITIITNKYFKKHYFKGNNEGLESTPILSLVHANVTKE